LGIVELNADIRYPLEQLTERQAKGRDVEMDICVAREEIETKDPIGPNEGDTAADANREVGYPLPLNLHVLKQVVIPAHLAQEIGGE
jgi:hypothetical protein